MANFLIPTATSNPHFVMQTQLDGLTYTIRVHWNEREGAFYLDVGDVDNVPIVTGRKLVADWPLLHRVRDEGKPPGEIYVVDKTGEGVDPGFDDLGKRVVLIYIDAAGVAEAAA